MYRQDSANRKKSVSSSASLTNLPTSTNPNNQHAFLDQHNGYELSNLSRKGGLNTTLPHLNDSSTSQHFTSNHGSYNKPFHLDDVEEGDYDNDDDVINYNYNGRNDNNHTSIDTSSNNTNKSTQPINNLSYTLPKRPAPTKPKEAGVLFPELTAGSYKLSAVSDTNYENLRPSSVIRVIDDTTSTEAICIDDSLESMARAIVKSSSSTNHSDKLRPKNTQHRVGSIFGSSSAPNKVSTNNKTDDDKNVLVSSSGSLMSDYHIYLPHNIHHAIPSSSLSFLNNDTSLKVGAHSPSSAPNITNTSNIDVDDKDHIDNDTTRSNYSGNSNNNNNNNNNITSQSTNEDEYYNDLKPSSSSRNNDDATNISMDFQDYKRQTAIQILTERRLERRKQRILRRRLRALKKEQYFGNYFQDQDPNAPNDLFDNIEFSYVSYAIDHFIGNRQNNPFYDLYLINNHDYSHSPINTNTINSISITNDDTHYSTSQNRDPSSNQMHRNHIRRSAVSFQSNQTNNIDEMSSDDGYDSNNNDTNPGSNYRNNTNYSMQSEDDAENYYSPSLSSSDSESSNIHTSDNPKHGLKRRLYSRHLTSISAASAIGISTMLVAGRALFIAGPLGALLGFMLTGGILSSIIAGYGEMVSLIPLHTGIAGTIARFVNPSMGYAIGVCYWVANTVALPAELTAAAMMLTNYPELAEHGVVIVWIIYIFFLVLLANLCSVRIYGEFQFLMNLVRIGMFIVLTIVLIVINTHPLNNSHSLGFLYWSSGKSDASNGWYYGLFRPLFPLYVTDTGSPADAIIWGIPGVLGRFAQFWQAVLESSRGYMNVSLVYSSVGEARNPRKSLARATKYIFWQILLFYCLSMFLLGITVYAGNVDLFGIQKNSTNPVSYRPNYHSNQTSTNSCADKNTMVLNTYDTGLNVSPWIVALQSAGFCSLANAMNAAFVVFAISSGSSNLYAASRTLYGIFRMYIEDAKIKKPSWWNLCGWCNGQGIPIYAVVVSFPFSFLALMNVKTPSFTVFQGLLVVSGSCAVISWVGMGVAFIRFHNAIQARTRANQHGLDNESQIVSEDLSRDGLAYPFKSPFQPFLAWFGLIGTLLIVLTMGFSVFIKDNWRTDTFFHCYISVLLFCFVYAAHHFMFGSRTPAISKIDLDSGRKELDRAEWSEDRKYSRNGVRAIWGWMFGRFRFIGVLFKTLQGDYSDMASEDDSSEFRKKLKVRKKKKKSKRKKR